MCSKSSNDEEDLSNNFAKLLHKAINESNEEAHKVHCNFNENHSYFRGVRYKCLVCTSYNLCGSCFESRCLNEKHKLSHPMACFEEPNILFGEKITDDQVNLESFLNRYKSEIHHNIVCDCCKTSPIEGLRFKCDICRDYDLCFACYSGKRLSKAHELKHPLIVIGVQTTLEVNPRNIKFIQKLGEGGFGAVFKSKIMPSEKIVATKVISINSLASIDQMETLKASFIQEYESYKEIKGVNILKMLGNSVLVSKDKVDLMIVTEFMEKGSLASVIENEPDLSFRKRLSIAVDIASGMSRIHNRNCIHRDIRPDNILINNNYTAKIGDFGITKFVNINEKDLKNTMIGCLRYMPPEFYKGECTNKLDTYTFGLTLVELFKGEHQKKGIEIIVRKEPIALLDLIQKCIQITPYSRPSSRYIE